MEIQLLYFDGCPNLHTAEERLTEALTLVGRPGQSVNLRAVETDQDAQAQHFTGSPTIRVDGNDLFPPTADTYGLTCRVYATPDGLAGAPTVEQLVEALNSNDQEAARIGTVAVRR
ncbi:thioredoxin family protein [Streptomyces sp. NBC_00846]|uniref:DF family (seleno)protein n=1 Tax=Streptomyces sp. NBC_00846 TaxID=2975849 RepID=UPI003865DE29|nr:thioredoxin family protein [Streptomyces sp. NBC_00846]